MVVTGRQINMAYRKRKLCLIIAACLVIISPLFWKMYRTYGPPGPWSKIFFRQPGPICILTSQDEMWIFIEIDWVVRFRHPLASPSALTIAHEQYVLRRSREGWKIPVKIDPEFTQTLNPNLSRIMESQDKMYLISEGKDRELPNVSVWDGDRFIQLSIKESTTIITRISYKEHTSLLNNVTNINAETERSGWRVAYLDRNPFFFWGDSKADFANFSKTNVKFS